MNGVRVVVLTNERDFAADSVIRHLHDRPGVEVCRINAESVRREPVIAWRPETETADELRTVVWWRQFEIDDHPPSLAGVDDILVERAQWRTWIAALRTPRTAWMNDLWAARRAENKIEQLRAAVDVGLDVPETLVTNDPNEAADFSTRVGGAVIKTLSSGYFAFSDQSFVFTEELDESIISRTDLWHAVPVIVQENLSSGLDARVISFGDHAFGAKCKAKGVDWRKTPFDPSAWTVWTVPTQVARGCAEYRQRLGIEFGAFDFMLVEDATYFLEANQAGEWMFLDRTLDLGIDEALADRLVEMGMSLA